MKNFKLFTLTLFLFSLMSTTVTAQISLGLKAGGNLSTTYGSPEELNDENIEGVGLTPGFQIGAFVGLGLTDGFKIIGEVAYEVRNGKKTIDLATAAPSPAGDILINVDSELNNSFHYINIPILAVFGSGPINFYAGPNFALLTKATSTRTTTQDVTLPPGLPAETPGLPQSGTVETEIDFKNDTAYEEFGSFINESDLGINVGFMFQATDKVFLDLRVNHGLTDATNNDYDVSLLDGSKRDDADRNISIQLSAGIQF